MALATALARSRLQRARGRVSTRSVAVASLLAAACIWGSTAVATKSALKYWPPMTLACVRWSIALAVMVALLQRAGTRPARGPGVAMLGLTGLLLFYVFYSWGLKHTTAASATLIGGGTPVIVAIVSAVALGEHISGRRALGILTSLAGVAAIVVASGSTVGASLPGNLLILGSSASWALYTVLSRRIGAGGNALATLAGTAIYGLLFMVPLAIGELIASGLGPITSHDVAVMLYLSLGPSAAAYLLWSYGLTQVEASQAAVYGNLMPLVGVVLAAALLDESITRVVLAGGLAIIAGAWLATSRPRSKTVRTSTEGGRRWHR